MHVTSSVAMRVTMITPRSLLGAVRNDNGDATSVRAISNAKLLRELSGRLLEPKCGRARSKPISRAAGGAAGAAERGALHKSCPDAANIRSREPTIVCWSRQSAAGGRGDSQASGSLHKTEINFLRGRLPAARPLLSAFGSAARRRRARLRRAKSAEDSGLESQVTQSVQHALGRLSAPLRSSDCEQRVRSCARRNDPCSFRMALAS